LSRSPGNSPGNSLRRQPKTERGKQRVEKILATAAEVFLEVGYEAATTHAIAARAKTAKGYGEEIRQNCLFLHSQGMSFREIERQTGISHNTVIVGVKQNKIPG
jgi:hypothetical protein